MRTSKYMNNQPLQERALAYCSYYKHRGYLSKKMIDSHGCLDKQCPHLHKTDHPYWECRSRKKANKKMRNALATKDAQKIADVIIKYAFIKYEMESEDEF